ncbi:tetratricopeptide repeat protein [candidate division KSB1 bacterium]|nr:tetratricopeptide repeat protein [candidate division KSB1 bacterium]
MNRFLFHHLHLDRHLVQLLLLLTAYHLLLPVKPILCKQTESLQQSSSSEEIPFRERLRHYVDMKTNQVVEDLLAREEQLLSLVHNIHDEIKLRDKEIWSKEDHAFARLDLHSDTLIDSYDRELVHLIKIYDDLNRLRRIADFAEETNVQSMITDSKTRLFKAVEHAELFAKVPFDYKRFTEILRAYTFELDSLLNIYDRLERLEMDATARQDERAVKSIEEQKGRLFKVMAQWGKWGPLAEQDFQSLQTELKQIDSMFVDINAFAEQEEGDHARQLEIIKRSLMNRVDRTVYDLMTDSDYRMASMPTVSDFIDAWKKKRYLDVEVKLTEYEIILKNLLDTADQEERQRMIARDINDALSSYSEKQYRLCEYQMDAILKRYRGFLVNRTPLQYYLAECQYNRAAYDAAAEMYKQVISDTSEPVFCTQSLVRLMQHARENGLSDDLFDYYHQLLAWSSKATESLLSYAHLIAAKEHFNQRQYEQAIVTLQKISVSSQLYWIAQLVQGIAYVNMNDFDRAVLIFKRLAEQKSYPWTNLQTAYLRNTALIRLGFLYYQRGDYNLAIKTFDKVSQGFIENDQALIGQAWANLRLGRFDRTLRSSSDILAKYLTSRFTYEALVLAAQCKQLMAQPEDALNAYRYVVRARGAKETSRVFQQERELTLQQAREIDRMEKEAMEKRRLDLYQEIETVRGHIDLILAGLPEQSDTAIRLMEAYDDERQELFDNLNKLDAVVLWAENNGQSEIAASARRQRNRVMKILYTYHLDRNIDDTALLMDFPLAAKESMFTYKNINMSQVYRELELEKRQLQQAIELVMQYKSQYPSSDRISEMNDLILLQDDLNRLRDRMSRFRNWIHEQKADEIQTNVDYWSNLAGFYLSDILDQKRHENIAEINENARRIQMIQSLFFRKKDEIENQLADYEQDIRHIQRELIARKNQLELLERKTYFEKYYFDDKVREQENWQNLPSTDNQP